MVVVQVLQCAAMMCHQSFVAHAKAAVLGARLADGGWDLENEAGDYGCAMPCRFRGRQSGTSVLRSLAVCE